MTNILTEMIPVYINTTIPYGTRNINIVRNLRNAISLRSKRYSEQYDIFRILKFGLSDKIEPNPVSILILPIVHIEDWFKLNIHGVTFPEQQWLELAPYSAIPPMFTKDIGWVDRTRNV